MDRQRSSVDAARRVLLAILLLGAVAVGAEEVQVLVQDSNGNILPGAVVWISQVDGSSPTIVVADANGVATFQLAVDEYALTVQLDGFQDANERLLVVPGGVNKVTIEMKKAPEEAPIRVVERLEVDNPGGISVGGALPSTGRPSLCVTLPNGNEMRTGSWNPDGVDLTGSFVDGVGGVQGLQAPRHCLVNGDSSRIFVSSGVDDALSAFSRAAGAFEYDGTIFDGSGGAQLQRAGPMSFSLDGSSLQVVVDGGVSIFQIEGQPLPSFRRFVPVPQVQQTTALAGGLGVATSLDGALSSYPLAGPAPTEASTPECEQARTIARLSREQLLVQCRHNYQTYRIGEHGPIRLASFPNITSRPGPLVNILDGPLFDGSPGHGSLVVVADGNQALLTGTSWNRDSANGRRRANVYFRFALRDSEVTQGLAAPQALATSPFRPPGTSPGTPLRSSGQPSSSPEKGRFLASFPSQDAVVAFEVDAPRDPEPAPGCVPTATRACAQQNRFSITVDWHDVEGNVGVGSVVPGGSDDSQLLTFFDPDNWEMLVKVLDGCAVNQHTWVFAAATTDVGYTLEVTDTSSGLVRTYSNPLGNAAAALTDTSAFPCDEVALRRVEHPGVRSDATPVSAADLGMCTDDTSVLCLSAARFEITVEWQDRQGNVGSGQVVPLRSADSGLLWFFDADNWEMLVKVLTGCAINNRYWVFAAATTDVAYTLRVVDTESGTSQEYANELGVAAPALTDTDAFLCTN